MVFRKGIWKYVRVICLLLAGISTLVTMACTNSEPEGKRSLYPKGPAVSDYLYQQAMKDFTSLATGERTRRLQDSAEVKVRAEKAITFLENNKLDPEPVLIFARLILAVGPYKSNSIALEFLDEDEDTTGIEITETRLDETPILVEYYPVWDGQSVPFYGRFILPVEMRKSENDSKDETEWEAYLVRKSPLARQMPRVFISLPEEGRKVYVRVVDRAGHKSNRAAVPYYTGEAAEELPKDWEQQEGSFVGETDVEDLYVDETIAEENPLACALLVAETIEHPYYKALTLAEIAPKFIATGEKGKALQVLSEALQVAETIYEPSSKANALIEIAERFAEAGEFDKALRVAKMLVWDDEQTKTLAEIAVKCGQVGERNKASQILSQLLEIAKTIDDPFDRAYGLAEIAVKYAQAGEFDEALEIAKTIEDAPLKSKVLAYLAPKYAEAEEKDRASQLLSEAFQLVKTLRYGQREPLLVIIDMCLEAREYEKALEVANEIPWDEDKVNALAMIAVKYAKAGERDKASEILLQAFDVAERVKDSLFDVIAAGYAEIGEYNQALEVAKRIEVAFDKAKILANIASNHMEAGEKDRGLQILSDSLKVARKTKDDGNRARMFAKIAGEYVEAGDRHKGLQILLEAVNWAKRIEDVQFKRLVLAEVAAEYAQVGEFEQAIEVARTIDDEFSEGKAEVLANIAIKCVEAGQSEIAFIAAKAVKEVPYKARVLVKIALKYAEGGQKADDRGKKILRQIIIELK